VLHRRAELDALIRAAVDSHDWTSVYPALHQFCNNDLSAFYFDVRKDALYCDRPDSLRRRAARTVLDRLHRCLCTWLAPVLVFTAEEAWTARFGEAGSVHLQDFAAVAPAWRDDALAERWQRIRERRRLGTLALEEMRRAGRIGSSLQAMVTLGFAEGEDTLLGAEAWAEILIVPGVALRTDPQPAEASLAAGSKCARCWKVLPEVGRNHAHPLLCERCADALESGLVGKSAA
jgi:isoleucyl-tRNA synthetase